MRTLWGVVAVLALVAGGVSNTAFAAPAAPDESSVKAREAFSEGMTFFNLGNFDEAVKAWTKGYQIKPDPVFLYNIAQAYRLAENFDKAVFFYKSYLRNSPKAPNVAEVQEKIDQLQKLIAEKRNQRDSPPEGPMSPGGKTPVQPRPVTPPATASTPPPSTAPGTAPTTPATTPPSGSTAVAQTESHPSESPAGGAVTESVTATAPRPSQRRIDITAYGGVNVWSLGVTGGAGPSAGIAVSGGYSVWRNDRLSLRIGVKVGYSYITDVGNKMDNFISVLAEPMLRIRLWQEKLYGFVGVGVGALVLTGIPAGSPLLKAGAVPSGTFAAAEVRPSVGVEYRVVPMFALFVSVGIIYNNAPDKNFASSTLLRIDAGGGASLRF